MATRPKKSKATPEPYPPGWEPFLTAINADLDDDTPRLVFADWLQENGDEARAEFIRLQCAAARGEKGADAANTLLKKHQARWLVGLPKGLRDRPEWCVFRRGFIAGLTVFGHHWTSKSPAAKPRDASGQWIRRITALEELRIEQVWDTVLKSHALAGIRSLELPSAGSAIITSLAKSPALPTLTDLTIREKKADGMSQESFRRLFAADKLDQLRRLHIQGLPFGMVIVVGLIARQFVGLEELRLRNVNLDAIGVIAFAHFPAKQLRLLDLHCNPLGDAGLRSLLAAPALQNLKELGLSMCDLTTESARALAEWEGLRSIRRLDLRYNGLRRPDAALIRDSRHAKNLTELLV